MKKAYKLTYRLKTISENGTHENELEKYFTSKVKAIQHVKDDCPNVFYDESNDTLFFDRINNSIEYDDGNIKIDYLTIHTITLY